MRDEEWVSRVVEGDIGGYGTGGVHFGRDVWGY